MRTNRFVGAFAGVTAALALGVAACGDGGKGESRVARPPGRFF